MDTPARTRYPSDIPNDEWAFIAPYLTLMREDAPQRQHPLRERFNGLRFIARTGLQWRFMPHDLPPWEAGYQQTRRWLAADVFGTLIADLRVLLRLGRDRAAQPTAVILDSRTLQSMPESEGAPAGTGPRRAWAARSIWPLTRLGSCCRCASTRARDQDLDQVGKLAAAVQAETG